jgi:hypothetical protein
VADVLRHRSLNTTLIYAKLDSKNLAAVALPWPGCAQPAREAKVRRRLAAGGGSLLRTRLGSEKSRISGGFWMIPEP